MSKRKKNKSPKKQIAPLIISPAEKAEAWFGRNGKWVLLLGWGVFIGFYLSLASDELGGVLGGDNARYLMLARSLAEHQSYRDWYLPGAPAHTQYPFLFPLILSVFAGTSREVFYSHLMIQFLASLVPLFLCAWARLEGESRLKSILIFFLAGSFPSWYSFLLNLLTEPVFMFFMFLTIFILSYAMKRGFDIYLAILLSLSVLASAMVREAGLVLFVALFLGIILDSRLRKVRVAKISLATMLAAVFILGWGGWTVRNMLTGEGGFYFKQLLEKNPYQPELGLINFGDLLERIRSNLLLHLPHIGGFAFPAWIFKTQSSLLTVSGFFFAVILLGLVSRIRARNLAVELIFVSMFGLSLVWFFWDDRFSLPVLPLAVFYFIKGVEAASKFLKARTQSATIAIVIALALWQMGFMVWLCVKYHDRQMYPETPVKVEGYGEWVKPVLDISKYSNYWKFSRQFWETTADWIVLQKVGREILPKDALVASRKPTLTWYFADRKATWYRYGVRPEEEWEFFRNKKFSHVLISSSNRELVEMVKAYPDNFKFLAVIQRSGLGIAQVEYPRE